MAEQPQPPPNDPCKDPRFRSLMMCLHFYNSMSAHMDDVDNLLIDYFQQYPVSNLLDDYSHIKTTYLDHNVANHNANFLAMSKQMNRYLQCHDVSKCANYRNLQNRRSSSRKIKMNSKLSFYVGILDSVHVLFAHSLHLGLRVDFDPKSSKPRDDGRNVVQCMASKQRELGNDSSLKSNQFLDIKFINGAAIDLIVDGRNGKRLSLGHRWYFWSHYAENEDADALNGGTPFSQWFVTSKVKDLKTEILSNLKLSIQQYDELMFAAVQFAECSSTMRALRVNEANLEAMHYGDDIDSESSVSTEHILAVLLFVEYPRMAESLMKAVRGQKEGESVAAIKERVSEYRNWYKTLREMVELFGSNTRSAAPQFAAFPMSSILIDEFTVNVHSPLIITPSISSAMAAAGPKGTILTLRSRRSKSVDDGLMYFDCGHLARFGFSDSNLIAGGYRALMIDTVRTMENEMNYQRFIHPMALLDQMLRGMAPLDHLQGDIAMDILSVMMEERRRCPDYMNMLFQHFVGSKKRITINMTILRKYYLQNTFFKEQMMCSDCDQFVALSFVSRLFPRCKVIEVEMEKDKEPKMEMEMQSAHKMEDSFYDSLLGEMEALHLMMMEIKTDLNEIRIYHIEIDEDQAAAFKKKLEMIKWNLEMIKEEEPKNMEQQKDSGTTISIKKVL